GACSSMLCSCTVARAPDSFPTRRSSDLAAGDADGGVRRDLQHVVAEPGPAPGGDAPLDLHRVADVLLQVDRHGLRGQEPPVVVRDRKSTRLNSSHDQISYAVLRLKKKKA